MDLRQFFIKVVGMFQKEEIRYALAGGLVASLYRTTDRLTKDLDFLILAGPHTGTKARQILRSLGLEPHALRKADLEGGPLFARKRRSTPVYILAGRREGDASKIGLDFILPEMPWFESAFQRSELNRIDFGFGPIPCLTVEDVVISKLYSLRNDPSRFNDLDDLKSIFLAKHTMDLPYIAGQMQKLNLPIPRPLRDITPKILNRIK